MAAEGERVALASFLAMSVLAGGNAVCIRFSNRELAPLWGAGLRFLLDLGPGLERGAPQREAVGHGWAIPRRPAPKPR